MTDETVLHTTVDAAWLPPGGIAEVIRASVPPARIAVVRLAVFDGDRVFCVPRVESAALDLPTRVVGHAATSTVLDALVREICGQAAVEFVGMVRNTVQHPTPAYPWPVPTAHFAVWRTTATPIVDGEWLTLGDESPLRARHWFPLLRQR